MMSLIDAYYKIRIEEDATGFKLYVPEMTMGDDVIGNLIKANSRILLYAKNNFDLALKSQSYTLSYANDYTNIGVLQFTSWIADPRPNRGVVICTEATNDCLLFKINNDVPGEFEVYVMNGLKDKQEALYSLLSQDLAEHFEVFKNYNMPF
jgi:hypothetical protein